MSDRHVPRGVECPECGLPFKAHGLAAHRGSAACRAHARARDMREAGWVRMDYKFQWLAVSLRAAKDDLPEALVRCEPTGYRANQVGKRSRVVLEYWLAAWAARLADRAREAGVRARDVRVALVRLGRNPGAQEWARAEAAIAGDDPRVLADLVRQLAAGPVV